MKITFDHSNANQNVDRATTSYRETRTTKTERAGDYALDISGTVMDNNAYGGHGKTAEEVMQDAAAIDVATQTDYMTVMSNTMSGEDFSRLQQEGYHPGDMEIEEVVTIVDTIKAELVKGGTEVVGYTDDLDADTLAQITGSQAFAQELAAQFRAHDIPLTVENVRAVKDAFERAMQTGEIGEGAVKYMVENRMDPTIENFYLADHSAASDSRRQAHGYYAADGTGYYAKKAEDYNWEQLRPQIERVLEEAGLEITDENVEGAQWLIGVGVPLTAETMQNLHEIGQAKQPWDKEKVLAAAAAAIAIIGGADGPTAIYVAKMLAENLVPTIAIAAYSYMALIPFIQKPLMRALTTKKERAIRMKPLRQVSKAEKIIFPVAVTLVVGLLLPDAIPLLGMLMLGNLFRESGVVERLSSQAQNGLINTVTIFLGISVGCKAKGEIFLTLQTIEILVIGICAFVLGTIGGLLVAKVMCKITKGKINPLIGSAGVSAVPMAARISEDVGRETDPQNHLLMHAMGPNVAGVIGSALAAGVLLACF